MGEKTIILYPKNCNYFVDQSNNVYFNIKSSSIYKPTQISTHAKF